MLQKLEQALKISLRLNTQSLECAVRMFEIASAEEQIALFKLVTDKVWQSLADQKRQDDEQAAQQRRQAAIAGGGRAKRGGAKPTPIKPLKPITPVPVAPPPKPQPRQPTQQQQQQRQQPKTTPPTTPLSFANDNSLQTMAAQNRGLADQRVAAYPQQRQQSAILPVRLR
jgi:hypothetical protein